jgi:hydrogenase maturation protease
VAARIIGVGQQWAGDDGVGIAVIRKLREAAARCELIELNEPARLIDLLTDGADPVVLVDALLDDGPSGRVLLIDSHRRDARSKHLLSTHGLGVMDAIELARALHPARVAPRIFLVAITVQEAARRGVGLSPVVDAAVPRAAAQALMLVARG